MATRWKYEETEMIRAIANIMAKDKGPFTKMMLVEKLSKQYTGCSKQELKNEVSGAMLTDRLCKEPKFVSVRVGVWDLKERVDRGQEK